MDGAEETETRVCGGRDSRTNRVGVQAGWILGNHFVGVEWMVAAMEDEVRLMDDSGVMLAE